MKYTVDYFIKKFQAIPEDRWLINLYGSDGKHCALGHCGGEIGHWNLETESLAIIISKHFNVTVSSINDGENEKYKQLTPKQRILAALDDIKKMQYPELSTTTINDLFECMPERL